VGWLCCTVSPVANPAWGDDGAHDGELQFFYTFVLAFSIPAFFLNVAMRAFGEFLRRHCFGRNFWL